MNEKTYETTGLASVPSAWLDFLSPYLLLFEIMLASQSFRET